MNRQIPRLQNFRPRILRIRLRKQVLEAQQALLHPGLSAGEHAVLEVEDTGPGMEEALRSRIFDPFFTTKERSSQKGTGLSLALSWQFIRNMGGQMEVESSPGKGSHFTIILPLQVDHVEGVPPMDSEPFAARPDLPEGSETLLLVDDEGSILEAASSLLHHLGYTVYTATNGNHALETFLALEGKVSAVILDLSMPVMDGRTCFSKLKDLNPDIRVIFASGYDMAHQAPDLLALGAKGVIQKPYNLGDLACAVRSTLDFP